MFLNCRNLETPFVPKALSLKHVRRAHHVPGTTLGTRGDLSNAHRLGILLFSRGWTRAFEVCVGAVSEHRPPPASHCSRLWYLDNTEHGHPWSFHLGGRGKKDSANTWV